MRREIVELMSDGDTIAEWERFEAMRIDADKLTVFYDGGCGVCRREVEKYRQMDQEGRLVFIDISAPSFEPSQYGGDLQQFMKKLHVLDASGEFYSGIDAFIRIWAVLPKSELHLLSTVVAFPGVNLLARSGYWLFARLRKFLP